MRRDAGLLDWDVEADWETRVVGDREAWEGVAFIDTVAVDGADGCGRVSGCVVGL